MPFLLEDCFVCLEDLFVLFIIQFLKGSIVYMMDKGVLRNGDLITGSLNGFRVIIILKHSNLVFLIQHTSLFDDVAADQGGKQGQTIYLRIRFSGMLCRVSISKFSKAYRILISCRNF